MMNIKMIWFYAALAASACGGAGIGYVATPRNDVLKTIEQAASYSNCEPTAADRAYQSGVVRNSRPKTYGVN